MEVAEVPKSWHEAFQNNSVAIVRTIENQLRTGASRDKERLRALVGGNYRDLLTTAEEIVALEKRTRSTEAHISSLSQSCKPPQQQVSPKPASAASSIAAQLHLLSQCVTSATSALRDKNVLLCAELAVIARLLLKSLSDQEPLPQSVERLRDGATALRTRLLRLIKSRLAHPASSINTLVHAICAYCLVTSASSGDAIKHYGEVRLEKLRHRVEQDGRNHVHVKEDFRYLVVSIQGLKSLLGRSVNDALTLLQKQPILQDKNVLRLDMLDIDRLNNLIPKDILSFIPYIKRVLLKKEDVQQISGQWATNASQVFAKGLQTVLASTALVDDVFALRKELLSVVLPLYFSILAQDTLLETVRQATNSRVLELCKTEVEALVQIGHTITSVDNAAIPISSLWEPSLVQKPLATDSTKYVHQVQHRHLGTQGELNRSIKRLRRWAKLVVSLRNQIRTLATARWQDLLEEPDDDDEETADRVMAQLTKDDPANFENLVNSVMTNAIASFEKTLQNAAAQVLTGKSDGDGGDEVAKIVHLLRCLRESSAVLGTFLPELELNISQIIPKLHEILADRVVQQILDTLEQTSTSKNTTAPVLDEMPSPRTFKFLRDVSHTMADTGGHDIWSAAAVSTLKIKLHSKVFEEDKRPDFISNDFDEHFVRAALGQALELDKSAPTDNTRSKARAYWTRTRLLFGVLG